MRELKEVNTDIDNVGTEVKLLNERKVNLYADREQVIEAHYKAYCESVEGKPADGMVKLYDVPRNSWVSLDKDPRTLFFFDHIDGTYSFCVTMEGHTCHVGATTLVYVHDIPNLYRPDFEEGHDE